MLEAKVTLLMVIPPPLAAVGAQKPKMVEVPTGAVPLTRGIQTL
jgi:hypothetical protein